MKTPIPGVYPYAYLFACVFVVQQGKSQAPSPGQPMSRTGASSPTLKASTNCPGSLLTVISPIGIVRIDWYKDNVLVQTANATWTGRTAAGANGRGSALNQFDTAVAVLVDTQGFLWVSDQANHRILQFPPGSTRFTDGKVVAGGLGPGSTTSQLDHPAGMFLDEAGNLYVADMYNHRVLKFAAGFSAGTNGTVVAGGNGLGHGLTELNSPVGVYVDKAGQLFVADRDNHRIMRYPPGSTGATAGTMVAGNNNPGPGAGELNQPVAVLLDSAGDLLIAEYRNHRVTKWTPLAPVGTVVAGGNGAGSALNQLRSPAGLFLDGGGRLLIADAGNDRILRWTPGDANGAAIIDNGEGTGNNQLNRPLGIVQTESGDYYIADMLNNRIQQFPLVITPTYAAATAATYKAVVTTIDGLVSTTANVVIYANAPLTPNVSITALQSAVCVGKSTSFTAIPDNGGTTPRYQWRINDTDAFAGSNSFTPAFLHNGDRVSCEMKPSSDVGCMIDTIATSNGITMILYPLPLVNAGTDKQIPTGASVKLEGTISNDVTAIKWTPASGLLNASTATPVASPATTTTYLLEATTSHGCTASDTVTVTVFTSMRIPNAFSPNGDGIHDTWELPDMQNAANASIQVYNRTGQLVYEVRGIRPGCGWNGRYRGNELPAGTYYYIIDTRNGNPPLSGSVTLLK